MEKDISTEEKIKEAARKLFIEKGYGLTRTRDIAEASGINLALMNYYFRSKENLYDIIMLESVKEVFTNLSEITFNENTTLSQKIDAIVNNYADMLKKSPNLPLFVLRELQANPQRLFKETRIPMKFLEKSSLFKQLKEQLEKNNIQTSPVHYFVNTIALTIIAVIGRPIISYVYPFEGDGYQDFFEERCKLIPKWIKEMIYLKE